MLATASTTSPPSSKPLSRPGLQTTRCRRRSSSTRCWRTRSTTPQRADWGQIWHLNKQYYNASFTRIWSSPEVKNGLPNIFVALNGALVLLVLRLLVPRLLAIESLADLDALAPELGLPSREELLDVVTYTQEMNYLTKLGLFLLVITVEKVTLIGEFIPFGVVLPAISPILFGGVLQGTVISAFCAALGSSANFVLAKSFFREKFLELSVFDQPAVGDSKWFNALSKNIEKDGFKAALFLRLAPVLPIPIDAHWYVCGLTPLKLWTEFFPAYFLGALKATFLDAYLGSMLTSGRFGPGRDRRGVERHRGGGDAGDCCGVGLGVAVCDADDYRSNAGGGV